MVDEAKRPTVNVHCAVRQGLKLQTYDPTDPRTVTVQHGANPGVDKEFFDKWMGANSQSSVVLAGMVSGVEEGKETADPWEGDRPHNEPTG